MAVATLTLTDIDLTKGSYRVDLDVQESEMSDGRMTAAHLTAAFMMTQIPTPVFAIAANGFAELCSVDCDQPSQKLSTVKVTLTDTDIAAGRFSDKFEIENVNCVPVRPSAAHTTAVFMIAQLRDPEFMQRVWDFAEEVVAQNAGAAITNTNDNVAEIAA
jgi:hypothetical protein